MARGWSRILVLVLLSYACKEVLKTDWKLAEDEDDMRERSGGRGEVVWQPRLIDLIR